MQRGDIYELRVPKGVGHEQHGRRFGVIVQSDALLPRSVVLLAPTSTGARPASIRPEIAVLGKTTRVLVEQVGAVDVSRLGKQVGRVAVDLMWSIDESLATVLGLD
ncbi:MAG: type II toxin-antitoxin system PemK/MazF family toxin [Acidimicrobiales bacterium]